MARKRIDGYSDVHKVCRKNGIPQRRCKTGHVMIGPLPGGRFETVTTAREYGPATRCKLTKLFAALGLLAIIIVGGILLWM